MSKITIRNLILSLVLLLISAGSFFYMVYEINDKNLLLQENMATLQTKQAQETSYFKLQKIVEESSADREELARYFFKKESDSIDFLNLVEALAPQAGVRLSTDGLQQLTDKKTNTSWVQVDFSFDGGYQNVKDFIEVLENLPYVSEITTLELSAGSGQNWRAKTTMKINVYAYDE